MLILFYGVCIFLTGIACLFFVPWLGSTRASCCLSILVLFSSYALYKLWGNDNILKDYYTPTAMTLREQNKALRIRLVDLSKAEYALRVRLERVPDAPRLTWQLEDLLAQRAMLAGAWREAYQHWQLALRALSKDPLRDGLHTQSQQRMTQMMHILKPFFEGDAQQQITH